MPLRENEVKRILEQARAAEVAEPTQKVGFEINDKVKIKNGPFADSEGEVTEIDANVGI